MFALELLSILILPFAAGNETIAPPWDSGIVKYQNITSFCPLGELCADSKDPVWDFYFHGCKCDQKCAIYGDCCRDSAYFKPSDELPVRFSCFRFPGSQQTVKMVGSCSSEADDIENHLCKDPGDSNPLLGLIPISVNTSENGVITYKNAYCAQCNELDYTDFLLWNIEVSCKRKLRNGTLYINQTNPTWDNEMKQWVKYIGEERVKCRMSVRPPSGVDIRNCSGKQIVVVVDSCPVNWTDSDVAHLCETYTAEIKTWYNESRSGFTIYKNKYCLECNNGKTEDVICAGEDYFMTEMRSGTWPVKKRKHFIQPIIIIMNTTSSHCKYGEVYDPFLQVCTLLLPPRRTRGVNTNVSVVLQNNTEEVNSTRLDHCTRYVLKTASFELSPDNETIRLLKFSRNFTVGQFRLTDDGQVEICRDDIPTKLPDSFSLFISIVTMLGLAVSIFFLVVHLCAVALVSELRNLSGMSLASLCLALLGAYGSFITGSLLFHSYDDWCVHAAVLTYYFFMSAFFWMMVLAFDVWRLLRESVKHLRILHGLQWRRFLSYATFAWGTPVLLSAGAVYIELAPGGTVDDQLRPQFGLHNCWFGNPTSLLMFFAIPLTAIMIVNLAFFTLSAVVTSRHSAAARQRKNFRLYVKLTVMLGLTWVVGLLASVLDNNVLWVIFAVLNTLQGFFIFVMFTLTSRVINGLTRTFPCCASLHRTGEVNQHHLRCRMNSKETSTVSGINSWKDSEI